MNIHKILAKFQSIEPHKNPTITSWSLLKQLLITKRIEITWKKKEYSINKSNPASI